MNSLSAALSKTDQIRVYLEGAIAGGELRPGERLAQLRELGAQFNASTTVVRLAIKALEKADRVERHGRGFVVKSAKKGEFTASRRSLSPGAGKTILILANHQQKIYLSQNYILPAVEVAARQSEMGTELCFFSYFRQLDTEYATRIVREKNYCGVLLMSSSFCEDDPEVRIFRKLAIPTVIMNAAPEDRKTGFAIVMSDNTAGWKAGLEHLAAKGHRRVAIISIPKSPRSVRGWAEADLLELISKMGMHGEIVYAPLETEAIEAELDKIFKKSPLPTALYCYSDFFAMEAMAYLRRIGLRIPEDVAVMGYCGYPGGTFLNPPLSTVDEQYTLIGETAVRLIAASKDWFGLPGSEPPTEVIPYVVRERESTRPIRHDGN